MKKEPEIRLNKEFGLNPTIPTCLICGKGKDEVVLLGAACKERAPMFSQLPWDIEPCVECRDTYLYKGVLLVEADKDYTFSKPRTIPTGRCVVISDEAFTRIFTGPTHPKKIAYVEVGVLEKIRAVSHPD